jgi:DNA repair protein RecO (recombination protein O)
MRYKKFTGVILKKQNYKEADQILTLWTKELGKVRVLAKSVRLPKSKLIYNLNELSVIDIEVIGHKNLPVVISANCRTNFRNLKDDLIKMGTAIYAAELMLKLTADEHPNKQAYDLMHDFFRQLNNTGEIEHYSLIDEFALNLSTTLGFGRPEKIKSHMDVRSFIEQLIERNIKSESLLNQLI